MIATTENATRTVAITGASGLVGSAVRDGLIGDGFRVKSIVRRDPTSYEDEIQWDTRTGFVNPDLLEGLDVVIHLAGESIAEGRWSDAKKARIRESRVRGTRVLAEALAGLDRKPSVLVSASAIGYYGDRGDEILTESSAPGQGFLPEVCEQWEAACESAVAAGIRVVNLRAGMVLSKSGGALAAMMTPFKLGLGGRVGSGRQYWSWVALPDMVGICRHVIATESLSGPVNAVSPNSHTNIEFTRALGKALGRPTIFPLPGFGARIVLGEMADGLLLASARVKPEKLEESGYDFHYPELDAALQAALS